MRTQVAPASDDLRYGLTELRRSKSDRYGIVALLGVMLFALATFVVAGFAEAASEPGLAVFLAAMGLVVGAITVPVLAEATARWRTRVSVYADHVKLDLPGRRTLVPLKPLRTTIERSEIEAIETRREVFRTVGTTTVQTAYALRLRDGKHVVLGADRDMMDPFYQRAVAHLAGLYGVEVIDCGAVEGRAGVIMLWGQSVPDWEGTSNGEGAGNAGVV